MKRALWADIVLAVLVLYAVIAGVTVIKQKRHLEAPRDAPARVVLGEGFPDFDCDDAGIAADACVLIMVGQRIELGDGKDHFGVAAVMDMRARCFEPLDPAKAAMFGLRDYAGGWREVTALPPDHVDPTFQHCGDGTSVAEMQVLLAELGHH